MDIEKEATLQGWVPQEQYRGEPDKWVDAEEFVRRGESIMPMIQHANKRLKSKIDELESTVTNLKNSVVASQESMEALKEFHAESTKAQVEKARRDILSQLREAKQDGNIEQEIQATEELSRFDAAQQAVRREVVPPKTQPAAQQSQQPEQPEILPFVKAWMKDNPWYSTDLERTGMMHGVVERLKREGSELKERDFLDAAARIVAERFGDSEPSHPVSKVEGGHRSSGKSSGSSSGYASLPAEAKAACDRQETRVVGDNRVYKTQKEWRDFYASEYFKGN